MVSVPSEKSVTSMGTVFKLRRDSER
jgi:hypothetical protein